MLSRVNQLELIVKQILKYNALNPYKEIENSYFLYCNARSQARFMSNEFEINQ